MFFTFLLLVSTISFAKAACTSTGKTVTASGFVMDNFCIVRGNLFDNPSVKTLVNPEKHSIHCLVDVAECTTSLFALLSPPTSNNSLYSISYQLGAAGTQLAITAANKARASGQATGFSMNVSGIDDGTSELKCVEILAAGTLKKEPITNGGIKSGSSTLSIALGILIPLLF